MLAIFRITTFTLFWSPLGAIMITFLIGFFAGWVGFGRNPTEREWKIMLVIGGIALAGFEVGLPFTGG